MNEHDKDNAFLKAVNKELDQRANAVDDPTREALRGMRKKAIEQLHNQTNNRPSYVAQYWRPYPMVAAAAGIVLVVGVMLRINITAPMDDLPGLDDEDMALLMAADDINFYQDLEFYQWLGSEQTDG